MKNKKPESPQGYATSLQQSVRLIGRRMVELHDKIDERHNGLDGLSTANIAEALMILCTQIGDLASDIDRSDELRTQAHIANLKSAEELDPSPFFKSRF